MLAPRQANDQIIDRYKNAIRYGKRHTPSYSVAVALIVYMVFYYYYKAYLEEMLGNSFRLLPVLLGMLVTCYIFYKLVSVKNCKTPDKPILAFFVFLFSIVISFFVTFSGAEKIFGLCSILLSILIFQMYPLDKAEWNKVFRLFVIAVILLLINGTTVENMAANPQKFNPNSCGFVLALLLCVCVVRYFTQRRLLYIVLSIACLLLQLVYTSRTAMLGCLMFLILFLILKCQKKSVSSKFAFWTVLIFSMLGVLVAYVYSEILFAQIGHGKIIIFGKDLFTGRQTIWSFTFQSISENFMFGAGSHLNEDKLAAGYYELIINAHNQPLGMLASFGFFPFVIFYIVLSYYVSNGYSKMHVKRKTCPMTVLLYIVVITIMSYFDIYFLSEYNWLPIIICYGLIVSSSKAYNKKVYHGYGIYTDF